MFRIVIVCLVSPQGWRSILRSQVGWWERQLANHYILNGKEESIALTLLFISSH